MQPVPLFAAIVTISGLAGCMPERTNTPSGAEDYAAYCADCHGAGGRGDGHGAEGLSRKPVDLAQIAARNRGVFPATRVMAKIYGYTGGRGGAQVMPAFGPLLESELVPYDGGDGIATPTPLRLVQIAEYLRGLQE